MNFPKTAELIRLKRSGKKWAMLTAYDSPTAEILETQGVDWILVGDSVGMVLLGYASTVDVTMDEMIHHAKAVRRGAPKSFVIGDMPLKGVEKGAKQALVSAKRFLGEAGCNAVKVEWAGAETLETVKLLRQHRIPVMGHLGLTPQTASKLGGYKVQAQDVQSALALYQNAQKLESLGVFSVLMECVPFPVARAVTRRLQIPTIGIGAGRFCDGQVLVFQDLVGLAKKMSPRFLKRYADLDSVAQKSVGRYIKEVQSGKFPSVKNSFGMNETQKKVFEDSLNGR